MMILSGIIVKEWFKSLIGAILVLFLLISTADLINGFLQGKAFTRVLLEYSLKMPDLMGKMLPICCLVASLFSLNKLKAHSELISILAAGYSYKQFYSLVGFCALTVVGLQFFNLGYLEPYANKIKRAEIKKSQSSEGRYLTRSSIDGGRFWYKSKNYFASFSYFDKKKLRLNHFQIYFFSPNHRSTHIIRSDYAQYQGGHWLLNNVTELLDLDESSFPTEQKRESQKILLYEVPEDFGEFAEDLTTLNYFKLRQFVSKLSKTDINISEYEIILLNKVILSLVCFVFALFPVSTIFNPNRRSSSFGMNVVQTLLVTVVFWVLYSSSLAFGNSGHFPPLLAVGLVPSAFFIYVILSYLKNQKLSI